MSRIGDCATCGDAVGIVLAGAGGVVVVVMVVRLVKLQLHTSPTHCYGRGMSTLVSKKEELAKVRQPKQQRNSLVRYVLAPIRTGLRSIRSYLRYRLRPKRKLFALNADRGEGIDKLHASANGSTCIAITGDWADGSANSRAVATAIEQVGADYTCHLGDIYSVGATQEIEHKFLGHDGGVAWPLGGFGGHTVPGNHEYNSGAHAFYDVALRQHCCGSPKFPTVDHRSSPGVERGGERV